MTLCGVSSSRVLSICMLHQHQTQCAPVPDQPVPGPATPRLYRQLHLSVFEQMLPTGQLETTSRHASSRPRMRQHPQPPYSGLACPGRPHFLPSTISSLKVPIPENHPPRSAGSVDPPLSRSSPPWSCHPNSGMTCRVPSRATHDLHMCDFVRQGSSDRCA